MGWAFFRPKPMRSVNSSLVARMERSAMRERRFRITQALHSGYSRRYAATSGPGAFKYCDVTACADQ